jgi:hypothetical protein
MSFRSFFLLSPEATSLATWPSGRCALKMKKYGLIKITQCALKEEAYRVGYRGAEGAVHS